MFPKKKKRQKKRKRMRKENNLLKSSQYLKKEDQKKVKTSILEIEKKLKDLGKKEDLSQTKKVFLKLTKWNVDKDTLIASLLSDLPSELLNLKKIKKRYGPKVVFLVNKITKLKKIIFHFERPKKDQVSEELFALRKLFISMAADFRVVLIMLAKKWQIMETLNKKEPNLQKSIALDALNIYAPLAYRLGMGELKGILEDLAFPYVFKEEYKWFFKISSKKYKEKEKFLEKIKKEIALLLKKAKIKAEIDIRPKHKYSLYQKLQREDYDLDKIYDLVVLRILVKSISLCYKTLGIIHRKYKPLPFRIMDYISIPKPNGYQSIHTTVFAGGQIIEIQIRTYEMHERDENGIAAYFSLPPFFSADKESQKFAFLRELEKWQRELKSSQDFLEGLRKDVFKKRIFVFTPKGHIIDLPEGAIPLDFAYHIHSELGNSFQKAKINGEIKPINYNLKNGDVVEIIKGRKAPSKKWLKFVRTQLARTKILEFYKKEKAKRGLVKRISKIIFLKRLKRKT